MYVQPSQVEKIHFLFRVSSKELLTFPRIKSHIRDEKGRSISLSSIILFAVNVPASWNS